MDSHRARYPDIMTQTTQTAQTTQTDAQTEARWQQLLATDPSWQVLFDERAAIYEYDGGLPRAEAERRARAHVLAVSSRLN